MTFTYTLGKVKSEALHWVRWRVGDTSEKKLVADDEEIEAALIDNGLTLTSDPASNAIAIHNAAADVCRGIAARLGRDSKITIGDVGSVKSTAAQFYLRLAKELREEVATELEDAPHEEIDSMDYRVTSVGEDLSEYVGDPL